MKHMNPTNLLTGSLLLLALVLSGCSDNLARGSGAAAESAEQVVRSDGSPEAPSPIAGSEPAGADDLELREARVARLEQDLERKVAELETRLAVEVPREQAIEVDRPRQDAVFVAYEPEPRPQPVQRAEPEPEPQPRVLTINVPAATTLDVAFVDAVSSEVVSEGDAVRARVTHDVYWRGYVAVPAGAEVQGTVSSVNRQKKIGGQARLAIQFDRILLPSGESLPIRATFEAAGKKQAKKDAATIGGSAAGGAILGRVLGGKGARGTAVGAVVGAAVGTVVASKNAGDPVSIAAGTPFELTLESPLEVQVERQPGTISIASR